MSATRRWIALAFGLAVALAVVVRWRRPARVPRPRAPDLAARVELGRRIFSDRGLSEPPGTSCASCHDADRAFAGNNGSTFGVPRGSRPGHFARRSTPSLLYLRYVRRFHYHWEEDAPLPDAFGGFFWDGRSDSLAALVEQPLTNPDEMNLRDRAELSRRLQASAYAGDLRGEFGDAALATPDGAMAAFGQALEAFLTSDQMAPFSSRYDDYLRGRATLTPVELRGMALFRNPEKGNCGSCHRFNPTSPSPARSLFTDYGYEAPAVPRNTRIPANRDPARVDLGLCERNEARSHTNDPRLCASFRTPSLRNVAVRSDLMHNGVFSHLRDAVAFYATRSTDPQRWYPSGVKFEDVPARYRRYVNERLVPYDRHEGERPRLDDGEIDAIVAFLRTLTDAPYASLAAAEMAADRKAEAALRRSNTSPAPAR
jgi:cytochrome c peroxidase